MMEEKTRETALEVADRLLSLLQAATGAHTLAYAQPPQEILGGFDTRIFSFELTGADTSFRGPLILRLFDSADDPVRSRWEAAVQNAISGMGYPAAEVLLAGDAGNPLASPFLVMRRLAGRPMLQAPTLAKVLPEAVKLVTQYPAVLADCQARLHDLDSGRLLRELEAAGLSGGEPAEAGASRRGATVDSQLEQLEERIERGSLTGLRDGFGWLVAHRPAEPPQLVICHGDFHPVNVLVQDGAVTGVVDWANTTVADPAFDVANTRLLLGIAPVRLPLAVDAVIGPLRQLVVRRYTRAYAARRVVDASRVGYFEALRCLVELAWVGDRRNAGFLTYRNPWGSDRSVRKLSRRFLKATGVKAVLTSIRSR
jgi:aminoglycoside phosphotransferase (APT) family kinase protein